jgi:hypothetical protein
MMEKSRNTAKGDFWPRLRLWEQTNFLSRILGSKLYRMRYPGKKGMKRSVTLAQKPYYEIYTARNNFLHGNPVMDKGLFPFGNIKRYPLTLFAPLL